MMDLQVQNLRLGVNVVLLSLIVAPPSEGEKHQIQTLKCQPMGQDTTKAMMALPSKETSRVLMLEGV